MEHPTIAGEKSAVSKARAAGEKSAFSKARLSRLRARLVERGLDGFISLAVANQRWLTGWRQVFDDEPAHLVLVTAQDCLVHTDSRYVESMRARAAGTSWQVDATRVSHAEFLFNYLEGLSVQGAARFKMGYEPTITLSAYRGLSRTLAKSTARLSNTRSLMATLRAVKDKEELDLLRKAQRITDRAFMRLLEWIKPGISELEVANKLRFNLGELGAEEVAFPPIVASGPNSALPHARPGQRRLRQGDFVVVDFGARSQDYCADMTRTLVIGQPTSQQKDVYAAVLEAHNQAKAALRSGLAGAKAHDIALQCLAQRGHAEHFSHSLGHGVGIEVHESPSLAPNSKDVLEPGNVVTVEPGVYLAGSGGVRIEDCGVICAYSFPDDQPVTPLSTENTDQSATVARDTPVAKAQGRRSQPARAATPPSSYDSFATSPRELIII
ncbi:MAG: aminopeptidase P family protein [Coriobacteriales bacterium]|jgi:Xaa-Pro aminopeptidase|nr:aminopeptidase P family protein [Coriobacteriales bacterium]